MAAAAAAATASAHIILYLCIIHYNEILTEEASDV